MWRTLVRNLVVANLEPSQTKTMMKLNLPNRKNNVVVLLQPTSIPFKLQIHLLLEVVELIENALTRTVESWFFLLSSLQQVDLDNNTFMRCKS